MILISGPKLNLPSTLDHLTPENFGFIGRPAGWGCRPSDEASNRALPLCLNPSKFGSGEVAASGIRAIDRCKRGEPKPPYGTALPAGVNMLVRSASILGKRAAARSASCSGFSTPKCRVASGKCLIA